VAGDIFEATVDGSPGPAKVNHRFMPVRRGSRAMLVKSPEYRRWQQDAVRVFGEVDGQSFPLGPVCVEIDAYWPRCNRKGPAANLCLGDVDAVAKAVLDALDAAEVIGDDAQVVEALLRKHYDKDHPRIVVKVTGAES
jgi:Holliday junction resolvase RusA-like endonuclease